MTVINGQTLLQITPFKNMATQKMKGHGVSWGLSEAGYDIRVKQDITFVPPSPLTFFRTMTGNQNGSLDDIALDAFHGYVLVGDVKTRGRFALGSSLEFFQIPKNLVAVIHDKSTWARSKLSVFNTVAEPGWNGFLTFEFVFHGVEEKLHIPAGAGIAQVIFSTISDVADYGDGKYQNQKDRPVESRWVSDQGVQNG